MERAQIYGNINKTKTKFNIFYEMDTSKLGNTNASIFCIVGSISFCG